MFDELGAATDACTVNHMFSMAFGVEVPVFELGYGSAIAVVMFLLVVILAGGFRKIFDRNNLQY